MTIKTHTIIKTRRGEKKAVIGTLPELVKYFGYTLQVGNSWNPRISRRPKTAAALIQALNASVAEKMRGSFDPDRYELGADGVTSVTVI